MHTPFRPMFAAAMLVACTLAAALLAGSTLQPARAGQLATPDISLQLVTGGLTRPVLVTHAGDGSGRLFIVEQYGRILIYDGSLAATAFLDIRGRVRSSNNGGGGEEGLLGLAFPPGYGTDREHFYVYYTNLDGNNQVSRFSLTGNPNVADSGSEERILLLAHPGQGNHNGGHIVFGPDGYLYIGPGDGGGGYDPNNNAQNPASLLGKMLRIDTELVSAAVPGHSHHLYLPVTINAGSTAARYRIPADNPFIANPAYRPEIWATGMRNPYRFSFDSLTGDLFIGDVGQDAREEIDFQPASSAGGENYGWDTWEGDHCIPGNCSTAGYTFPIHTYNHDLPPCTSLTGGVVHRGAAYPDIAGFYFFSDYCTGAIGALQKDGAAWVVHTFPEVLGGITSFGVDESGNLYFTHHSPGELYRLTSP